MANPDNSANIGMIVLDCQNSTAKKSDTGRFDVDYGSAGKVHVARMRLVKKFSARVHYALLGSEPHDGSACASRAEEVGGVLMLLGNVR